MSISKKFLKTKPVCKVTFELSKVGAKNAETVHLVGDFNQWDQHSLPMKKQKDGSFKLVLDLAIDQEYQFRYLLDDHLWKNEDGADGYVPSPFGDNNSLLKI
jgi:1,4-alpha-glucan branching enzyme